MLQAGVIGAPIGWKQTPHRNHDAVSPPSAFKTMTWPPSTCLSIGYLSDLGYQRPFDRWVRFRDL